MYLGDFMKEHETLENEYKEFCIKTNIYNYYTQEDLNYIITTGKLDENFNNMIKDNLKLYSDIYIPKYASGFANSQIQNGKLQIGVNDNGEVTGIPFFGNIQKSYIKKLVENAKEKYLLKNVKTNIHITKLKYNHHLITDRIQDIVKETKKSNKIYKLIQDNYFFERQKWVTEVLKYSVKLSTIIQNEYTRKKFYIWLKKNKCPMYNEIIRSKWEDVESINNKRSLIINKSNIIHWIALYKDETMTKLQNIKPENPNINKFFNSSVYLMTHLTDMRVKLLKNNNSLNYYKIDIIFDTQSNEDVSYKKVNRPYIYKSYRKNNDSGPYSITTVF